MLVRSLLFFLFITASASAAADAPKAANNKAEKLSPLKFIGSHSKELKKRFPKLKISQNSGRLSFAGRLCALTFNRSKICTSVTWAGNISSAELNELFPVSAKLSNNTRIVEIVRNGLSGIALSPLPVAPSELKPMQGVAYFEIDTADRMWLEMLENRDAIALHVDTRISELEVMLYALR